MIRAVLVLAALGGCASASPEDDAIAICEARLLEKLRSPATYVRVKATVGQTDPGYKVAFITYDAANAFGTPVRGLDSCVFKLDATGELPSKGEMQLDAITSDTERLERQQRRGGESEQFVIGNVIVGDCCVPAAKAPARTNAPAQP
ncbi:hypothetical protein [Sphingomonas sp.]|uniref:hypothetical protein n=1 Tax=Sphingomonas sp. TaxID=28214 RepID=UPI003BA89149